MNTIGTLFSNLYEWAVPSAAEPIGIFLHMKNLCGISIGSRAVHRSGWLREVFGRSLCDVMRYLRIERNVEDSYRITGYVYGTRAIIILTPLDISQGNADICNLKPNAITTGTTTTGTTTTGTTGATALNLYSAISSFATRSIQYHANILRAEWPFELDLFDRTFGQSTNGSVMWSYLVTANCTMFPSGIIQTLQSMARDGIEENAIVSSDLDPEFDYLIEQENEFGGQKQSPASQPTTMIEAIDTEDAAEESSSEDFDSNNFNSSGDLGSAEDPSVDDLGLGLFIMQNTQDKSKFQTHRMEDIGWNAAHWMMFDDTDLDLDSDLDSDLSEGIAVSPSSPALALALALPLPLPNDGVLSKGALDSDSDSDSDSSEGSLVVHLIRNVKDKVPV